MEHEENSSICQTQKNTIPIFKEKVLQVSESMNSALGNLLGHTEYLMRRENDFNDDDAKKWWQLFLHWKYFSRKKLDRFQMDHMNFLGFERS